MAHIASCIADLDVGSISKPASPVFSSYSPQAANDDTSRPFTFRMQQPEQPRRYQFFPKEKPLPVLNSGKVLDPTSAFAIAMNQSSTGKTEKPSAAAGLKIRITQQNLVRRRKVSVPELGPMTTVQEISMDSPTIPGRPALHERSISAPGNTSCPRRTPDDNLYDPPSNGLGESFSSALEAAIDTALENASYTPTLPTPRQQLTRLVIPENKSAAISLTSKRSCNQLYSSHNTHARNESAPWNRTAFTPSTSTTDLTTPRSAGTTAPSTATTFQTPMSAVEASRASPKPWERRCMTPAGTERTMTPKADDPIRSASALGHRRGGSESTMMDRGRPRKRGEQRLQQNLSMSDLKTAAARSADRKAFEELPKGWKPSEAGSHFTSSETEKLLKQAIGQAERFEVLHPDDVEHLSKELRRLDERTEYLRRTYNSLRAGRRNLHSRICQYLRSPRVAKFSHDSMLKQEEALAELDTSIDDWVSKLEKAENRRTRVRQKLLEHVAAATMLPVTSQSTKSESTEEKSGIVSGARIMDMATPPRSPSKPTFSPPRNGSASPSPQRVVAQVPSTIFEQPFEEAAERHSQKAKSLRRGDVESIRIYAGDDVYALLADVENEISKLRGGASPEPYMPESKRTEIHRQQSHEALNGTGEAVQKDLVTPLTPPAPAPPSKDEPIKGDFLLSSAVFRG